MNEGELNHKRRLNELIYKTKDIQGFLDYVDVLTAHCVKVVNTDVAFVDVIEKKIIHVITTLKDPNVSLYFGKTMRDVKCVISDKHNRKHEMWLRYVEPKILRISNVNLPCSPILDTTYKSLEEVIKVFMKYVDELSNYFEQMDLINKYCTVMEPIKPTYREDYRKIYIADRIWLHVEVSPNGCVKKMKLINPLKQYDQTLKELCNNWDFGLDVATNVIKIIEYFSKEMPNTRAIIRDKQAIKVPDCSICLCVELVGDNRIPLPLCMCGAYYHRSCLFEWFVTRIPHYLPSIEVAYFCPSCEKPIRCSEKD